MNVKLQCENVKVAVHGAETYLAIAKTGLMCCKSSVLHKAVIKFFRRQNLSSVCKQEIQAMLCVMKNKCQQEGQKSFSKLQISLLEWSVSVKLAMGTLSQ